MHILCIFFIVTASLVVTSGLVPTTSILIVVLLMELLWRKVSLDDGERVFSASASRLPLYGGVGNVAEAGRKDDYVSRRRQIVYDWKNHHQPRFYGMICSSVV